MPKQMWHHLTDVHKILIKLSNKVVTRPTVDTTLTYYFLAEIMSMIKNKKVIKTRFRNYYLNHQLSNQVNLIHSNLESLHNQTFYLTIHIIKLSKLLTTLKFTFKKLHITEYYHFLVLKLAFVTSNVVN